MSKAKAHSGWAPYLFLAPFLAVFLVFIAYPMVLSASMAFQQNAGPGVSEPVGFKNFTWMVQDPAFWTAVKNTTIFAAASVFIQLPASLGLAMLLNSDRVRGRGIWRMIFFAPVLVGLPFVAVLAGLVFQKNTGMLNVTLHALFGFDKEFPWLQEYVMLALIVASFWMYVGFNMIYFLAALQNVNKDLLEAAEVDGANAWQRFRSVVIPAIRPVAAFVVLLSLIGSFQLFELPYLMLNESAGPNNQGLTLVVYLYQQGFDRGDLGYASAVGWMLALVLFGFAIVQRLVNRESEADA
ncbi:MAG: carbohydrate ABC transporter permease [Phycisphaeraceae bacterium]